MMDRSDETKAFGADLAHLARLAATGAHEDVRLYLARLVRKYRASHPELAGSLEESLKKTQTAAGRASPVLRRAEVRNPEFPIPAPVDRDSQLALLRVFDDRTGIQAPLLPPDITLAIESVVVERQNAVLLKSKGLRATKSLAFVGAPGVGKTLSARWLASRLAQPLYVLDLTAVMSSLLGRTGQNVRAVFDHVRQQEGILLLDEFDAIAKRRSDDADVGELKRLVTVMLQEIDSWPENSLLMAATNHPELVDPALWRRFDAVVRFPNPTEASIAEAIRRFLGPDEAEFARYVRPMAGVFLGQTLAEVERTIGQIRRRLVLAVGTPRDVLRTLVEERIPPLKKSERIQLACTWAAEGSLSHSEIHDITGVSRDTIRKHAGPSNRVGRGRKP